MMISLTPETQKLLEEQMKKAGYTDPDAVVRLALENLGHVEGETLEELPADVQAAIETAEAQSARGEGRPWATVKEELRARFVRA